ncbi:hypothetical protein ILUMI_05201 [Ignelater luminosus]|uniref:GH18 domain-containing protein n=1 Tax=Ignelater luminosus TaxID=2038154 RepID=A0A8K0D7Q8_IGNLU|nr:hypothetical protein ILUMI_05201 [Ignelater luminosus]
MLIRRKLGEEFYTLFPELVDDDYTFAMIYHTVQKRTISFVSASSRLFHKAMLGKLILGAIAFLAVACNSQVSRTKVVCYYDSKGNFRDGQARFENTFLAEPLQFCTHLIYGYAGINPSTYKLVPLNEQFDVTRDNYRQITNLKLRYPGLRVLLSVGGGRDSEDKEKYLTLLESVEHRLAFINSAHTLLKSYGFDGLDLAWEFPPNKPKKIRSTLGSIWSSVKHTFVDPSQIDEKAAEHKEEFTALVRETRNAFRHDGLLLTMSVLPNVNSTMFHDVHALVPNLDFVNLWAFDYYTPERNPKEADYPAPLHELIDRKFDENGNYLVQYWLQNGAPNNKLILGIPTYGRTWKMTDDSGLTGVPPISDIKGAGDAGPYTKEEGLLSYQEVCAKLTNPNNVKGGSVLRKVGDPSGKFGTYAYHIADDDNYGTWVGYEDPDTAGNKATYVRSKGLGGIAIVDLTLDDFRGLCTGNKYPILRAAKFRL